MLPWRPITPLTNVHQLIDSNICSLCGACVVACPLNVLRFDPKEPSRMTKGPDKCFECYLCLYVCPQANLWARRDLYEQPVKPLKAYQAKSRSDEILSLAQDGGITTLLSIFALKERLADVVILAGVGEDWTPKPIAARSVDEVLKSSKSKYFYIPSLVALLEARDAERIMVVGLPCQLRALEKLIRVNAELSSTIVYYIGLFC